MRFGKIGWAAWWAALCLPAAGHAAEQASFDCTKASTAIEKAICADPALAAADRKLAETYQAASAKLSDEGRSALRDEQRQWLKRLRLVCGEATPVGACVVDGYRTRQKDLETVTTRYGDVTIRRAQFFVTQRASDSDDIVAGKVGMAPRYPGFAIGDIAYRRSTIPGPMRTDRSTWR